MARLGMRTVWVKKWDKREVRNRAEAQGCCVADVVSELLNATVPRPVGIEAHYHTGEGKRARLGVYGQDLVRLRALKREWGLYIHQVITHLLAEVPPSARNDVARRRDEMSERTRKGVKPADVATWQKMVRNAAEYRRMIAEWEAGCRKE